MVRLNLFARHFKFIVASLWLALASCDFNTEIAFNDGYSVIPAFNVADSSANEGSSVNFSFSLEKPAVKDFEIHWSVDFINSNSSDIVALTGISQVKKGDASFTILIPTNEDNSYEADEEFNLKITKVNDKETDEVVAKGTITNNDPSPTVQFQNVSKTKAENTGVATALVLLDVAAGVDVYVPYTLSGTADGSDHDLVADMLHIPAGDLATGFAITLNDDSAPESDETLIITLSTPINGQLGAQNTHTITITDNDGALNITSPSASDYIQSSNVSSFTVSGSCSTDGQEVTISADDTNGGTSAVTPGVQPTCTSNSFSANLNLSSLDDDSITISAVHIAANDSVVLTKDTAAPSLAIQQSISETIGSCVFSNQSDPTGTLPLEYKITANEDINPASLTASDIANAGDGGGTTLTWTIASCGDNRNFSLKATAVAPYGTVQPSIAIGSVNDVPGNSNSAPSSSSDNSIYYDPYLWIGGVDTNWTTGGNWAGGSAPGAANVATFDSPCGASCNVTVNAPVNVGGVNIRSGYPGTITQAASQTITIGNSGWSQAGGTFTGGNSNITINEAAMLIDGGDFTSTSGLLKIDADIANQTIFRVGNTVTFNHSNGTFEIEGGRNKTYTIDTPAGIQFYNFVLDKGNDLNSTPTFIANLASNSDLIVLNDLTLEVSSGGHLEVNNGTIKLHGDLIGEDNRLTDGTAIIEIVGTGNQEYRSANGGILPTVRMDKPSGSFLAASGEDTLHVKKLFLDNGTFSAPSSLLFIEASGENGGDLFTYAATASFIDNGGTLRLEGGYNNGTLTTNLQKDLTVSGLIVNRSYDTGTAGTTTHDMTGSGVLTVGGNFSMGTNASRKSMLNGSVRVQGNLLFGATASGGNANILINGSGDQNLNASDKIPAGTITIDKPSGTLSLTSHIVHDEAGTSDFVVNNGVVDLNGRNLTVADQLNVGDGIGGASTARLIRGCSALTAGTQNIHPADGAVIGSSSNPDISIADASVTEGGDLVFNVTLTEGVCGGDFTVNYAVTDGTAKSAHSDYDSGAIVDSDATPNDGTLTLTNAATSGTITVPTTSDAAMEMHEDLTITLSARSHGNFTDNVATGTIENDDDNGFIWTGDAGDNDFNNGANWSNGSTAPGPTNTVYFNSLCNDIPANCSANSTANINVRGMWIESDYPGTITQNAGHSVSIGNLGFEMRAGTFTGSSSGDQISLTLSTPSSEAKNFRLVGGSFTSTSGLLDIYCQTNNGIICPTRLIEILSPASFTHNSGTFKPHGRDDHWGSQIYQIVIDSALNLHNLNLHGRDYGRGGHQIIGGHPIIINNDFTHTGGHALGGQWHIKGNLYLNGAPNFAKAESMGELILNGSGDQYYYPDASQVTSQFVINKSSGNVLPGNTNNLKVMAFKMQQGSFTAPTGLMRVGYNRGSAGAVPPGTIFDIENGSGATFNHNNGQVQLYGEDSHYGTGDFTVNVDSSLQLYDLSLYARSTSSGLILTSGDTLVVNNNLTHLNGFIDSGTIQIKNHLDITAGADGGTTQLEFVGSSNQNWTHNGLNHEGHVVINKASGDVVLQTAVTLNTAGQDLSIDDGDLDLNGYSLTVNDQINIGNGIGAASSARILRGCSTINGTQNVNPADGEVVNSSSSPNVTISDESENEGENLVFTVTLSEAVCASAFTVNYASVDGSATTANSDYTSTSGSLNIPAGNFSGTITVPTGNDSTLESDEHLIMGINTASHGSITDASGVGTIRNEDGQENTTILSSSGDNDNSEWDGTHISIDSTYDGNGLTDGTWLNTTGLVGYWKLNDDPVSHNSTVIDTQSTSNGTLITNNGATNKSVAGQMGKGINFDGTDDYISLVDNAIFDPGGTMTSCLWVYPDSDQTGQPLFMQDVSSGRTTTSYKWIGAYLTNSSQNLATYVRISSTHYSATFDSGTAGLFTKRWTHICSTFDRSLPFGRLKLFIDGELKASHDATDGDIDSGSYPVLGVWAHGTPVYFDGKLDEVSLWSRTLSSKEIKKVYNMQRASYTGLYTSEVIDAGSSQDWKVFSWDPVSPYLKQLPSSGGQEGGYFSRNVAMTTPTTTNELLLKFNETGTPTTFTDDSGSSNDFTCTNCPTPTLDGRFGGAMKFDGVNDTITRQDASLNNSEFTVSLWIKPYRIPDNSINEEIITKTVNDGDTYATFNFSWDHINIGAEYAWKFHDGVMWRRVQYSSMPPVNQWSHILLTYDGTTFRTYLNGQYDGQYVGTPPFGNNDLRIGSGGNGTTTFNYFKGEIDEVAIWDKALTDTQIQNIYHRGGHRVRFQVRSCPDFTCSTEPDFVGPAGDVEEYFSEIQNNSLGLPSLDITGSVPTNRYFQYRMFMESDNSSSSPSVNNIRAYSE